MTKTGTHILARLVSVSGEAQGHSILLLQETSLEGLLWKGYTSCGSSRHRIISPLWKDLVHINSGFSNVILAKRIVVGDGKGTGYFSFLSFIINM